jgi:hypothetical protein
MEKLELNAMVDRIIKQLTKDFDPVSPEQTAKVRQTLERPCAAVLEMTRREIEKFRTETVPRTRDAKPTIPAVKGKREKNNPQLPRK